MEKLSLIKFGSAEILPEMFNWHGVKVGPGRRDTEPWDPWSRHSGPPSKFKSGTRDPPKV